MKEFVESGGIVVVMGVAPSASSLDVDPGGVDADPYRGTGSATISDPTHPWLTGSGIGGVPLTAAEFDPFSTGGRASFVNVPGGSAATIVENASGPVVVEYFLGPGRIWTAATDREHTNCSENLLRYIQSLF